MIRAQVRDNFAFGSDLVAIRFSSGDSEIRLPRQVAKVVIREYEGAVLEYEPCEPDLAMGGRPTLCLAEPEARALLEALAAHFGGTGPAKAARDDFLHERGRVDKLTDALIGIAWSKDGRLTA